MSEIAVPDAPDPAPTTRTGNPSADMLVSWARGAQAADYLAGPVSGTRFAGAFRGDQQGATAAILYGAEVGLTPIMALQSVHIVQDRPGLYARTMHAIVLAAGHQIWTESSTASSVVVCGQRAGSRHVERVEWTMQRARSAGYAQRNKKYEQDPEAMLWARAVSECCRRVAPDALAGLSHSVEELEDVVTGTATTVTRQPAPEAPKRVQRKRAEAPAIEPPPLDPEPEPAPEPEPTPEAPAELEPTPEAETQPEAPSEPMVTKAQLAKMQATLAGRGIKDRQARLDLVAGIIGRQVESSNDLTKLEASRVIDHLTNTIDHLTNADWPEPTPTPDGLPLDGDDQ